MWPTLGLTRPPLMHHPDARPFCKILGAFLQLVVSGKTAEGGLFVVVGAGGFDGEVVFYIWERFTWVLLKKAVGHVS